MEKKRRRDSFWLDLPQPLVELILERLHVVDYVSFGAVCRAWEAIQRNHRGRHAPSPPPTLPLPWLVYSTVDSAERVCYSPFKDRFYSLQLPNAKGTHCVASSQGWLLLIDKPDYTQFPFCANRELILSNPISGRRIQLPELTVGLLSPITATMSSAPTDPSCVIVIITEADICWCQVGDHNWTRLQQTATPVVMAVFCGGKLYCRSRKHSLIIVEPLARPARMQLLKMDTRHVQTTGYLNFMVESKGEILLLTASEYDHRITKFHVFTADLIRKMWVRVENLGDRVLFVSPACSISLSATELGSKGNKIYFSLPPPPYLSTSSMQGIQSPWKEFHLGSGTIIDEPAPYATRKYNCRKMQKCDTAWILPNLDSSKPVLDCSSRN